MAWYPGQEFGHALADVLLGRAEPGGRLPITWPRLLADTPFALPIPEPGPPRPGATLPYSEGLLVGYRSYDSCDVEPHFPFGFGLGYTTFDLGTATVGGRAATGVGEPVEIVVPVTNTGSRPGKCVVQLYLGGTVVGTDPTDHEFERPRRALAAFGAVRAEPGQTTDVVLTIPARAFARWDDESSVWVEDSGQREVFIGLSSRDLASPIGLDRTGLAE